MAKFQMGVTLNTEENITARVSDGAAGNSATQLTRLDQGKFVKMVGDSQYGLCAAGDQIEALASALDDVAPADGFNLGSLQVEGRAKVTLDGLQATPGTGTIAVGDYVVAGTVTARGTALSAAPKVCKATAAANTLIFQWRVIAILAGGTGAVGNTAVIERL